MSIAVNVIKDAGDNKVLVSKKSISKNQAHEKLYLVDKDKSDKFVKQLKTNDTLNNTCDVMGVILSGTVAYQMGKNMKSGGIVGKVLTGALTGLGTLVCCAKFDQLLRKTTEQNNLKLFKAQDVTGQNIEDIN